MAPAAETLPLIANWRAQDHTISKLPRGNHRISQEEVLATQKGRIMRATLELVGRVGPGPISISEISRGAKVSRKTFYSIFDSYEDCLTQAFMTAHLVLGTEMAAAVERSDLTGDWPRLRATIGEFLAMAAEEPLIAVAVLGNEFAAENGMAPIWRQVREAQRGILAGYWREDRAAMNIPALPQPEPALLWAAVFMVEALILDALASGAEEGLASRTDEIVAAVVRVLQA